MFSYVIRLHECRLRFHIRFTSSLRNHLVVRVGTYIHTLNEMSLLSQRLCRKPYHTTFRLSAKTMWE